MSIEETLQAYDLYDAEIVSHGFRATMRDYRLVVERLDYPPVGMFHYDFLGCVEAHYELTLPADAFSMDERLLDPQAVDVPEGFRWWVASACSAEEGVTLIGTSDRAADWTDRLGLPMHEVVIGTNVFRLSLVFYDLRVQPALGATQQPSAPDF